MTHLASAGNGFPLSGDEDSLESDFHALNLECLAAIEIVPTTNIADHLHLDKRKQLLWL